MLRHFIIEKKAIKYKFYVNFAFKKHSLTKVMSKISRKKKILKINYKQITPQLARNVFFCNRLCSKIILLLNIVNNVYSRERIHNTIIPEKMKCGVYENI